MVPSFLRRGTHTVIDDPRTGMTSRSERCLPWPQSKLGKRDMRLGVDSQTIAVSQGYLNCRINLRTSHRLTHPRSEVEVVGLDRSGVLPFADKTVTIMRTFMYLSINF